MRVSGFGMPAEGETKRVNGGELKMIRVPPEVHEALVKRKGQLETERGELMTLGEALAAMLGIPIPDKVRVAPVDEGGEQISGDSTEQ
jgi:hypothetical protein